MKKQYPHQFDERERQDVSRRALRELPETIMRLVAYNAASFLVLWGTGFLAFKAVVAGWGIIMVSALWMTESSRPSTEHPLEVPVYWHGAFAIAFQIVIIVVVYLVSKVIPMGHLLI